MAESTDSSVPGDTSEDHLRGDPSQGDSQNGPGQAENEPLTGEGHEYLCGGNAQRPQDPDVTPPAEHRDQDGVVDEIDAHQQSNGGECEEVDPECTQHPFDAFIAARGPLHPHPIRKPQSGDDRLRAGFRQKEVDARQLSNHPETRLHHGDVGDHDRPVERGGRTLGFENAPHGQRPALSAELQRNSAAEVEAVVSCQSRRDDDGVILKERELLLQRRGLVSWCRDDAGVAVIAEMKVAEKVDAQEAHGLLPTRRLDQALDVDDRCELSTAFPDAAQAEKNALVEQGDLRYHLVIRAARHRVDGLAKGAESALVGELNRHDHGHSDRDAENRQRAAEGLPPQWTKDECAPDRVSAPHGHPPL
jgi:hypothetical protein